MPQNDFICRREDRHGDLAQGKIKISILNPFFGRIALLLASPETPKTASCRAAGYEATDGLSSVFVKPSQSLLNGVEPYRLNSTKLKFPFRIHFTKHT